MIFQENDFLKTYNEIDKLWEDAENTSGELISDNTGSGELFGAIIERAYAFHNRGSKRSLEDGDIKFWTRIQAILRSKYKRALQSQDWTTWWDRFVNGFYKPYLMETAIREQEAENPTTSIVYLDPPAHYANEDNYALIIKLKVKNLNYQDPDRDKIYPDFDTKGERKKVKPDYLGNFEFSFKKKGEAEKLIPKDNISVECKSGTTSSSKHDAPLVILYTPDYQNCSGTYTFAPTSSFENLLNEAYESAYGEELSVDFKDINHIFLKCQDIKAVTIEPWPQNKDIGKDFTFTKLTNILRSIQKQLAATEGSVDGPKIKILADQTQNLMNDAETYAKNDKLKLPVNPPKQDIEHLKSPEEAANSMRKAADYLAAVVINSDDISSG